MVQIVEGGDTWRLCSIEDKLMEEPVHQMDQGNEVSVTLRKGNSIEDKGKHFEQLGADESITGNTSNPTSNGQENEMVIKQKMSKEAKNLVASLVKEVPTGEALKDSGKVEPVVVANQAPTGRKDVNESEESDHVEEPIHVKSYPETEKAKPTVSTPTNISETSVQTTKVIESKVTSESLLISDKSTTYNEISTILQNKETTTPYPVFSVPVAEPNELRRRLTANKSIANSNGILSSNQIVTESYPTGANRGSTEKGETLSTEEATVGSSNVLQTTTNLEPVERVLGNSRQTSSNTPHSRLKPNVEGTTSSYSITPSPPHLSLDQE